jgi:hypothetical protein
MPIRSRESLIGAWAFLAGIILAVVVGVFATFVGTANATPIVLSLLAVLGLVVGYFVSEKDVQTFLLASVSLVIVSFAGIQGLVLSAAVSGININELITSVLGALLFLFIPATIVVALKTVFSLARS